MQHFIIDGNNLIGRDAQLKQIQKRDKQASREKLARILGNYFADKKAIVSLHFDGFPNEAINIQKTKIVYSEAQTADEKIKYEIEHAKSTSKIIVVSSDNNIREFAKVCGCKVLSSSEFFLLISKQKKVIDEKKEIDNDIEFYKKLFND